MMGRALHSETNYRWERHLAVLLLSMMLLLLSGCISAASVGHSGKHLVDTSHKADILQSAYRLPDGNIVLFVSGRLSKREGPGSFSLLVPKEALDEIQRNQYEAYASSRGYRTAVIYEATIGPPIEFKMETWTSLAIAMAHPSSPLTVYADYLPAKPAPVIYAAPNAPGAANERGLRELWGDIKLYYVDTYPDGTAFRCEIKPRAEHIEKTRNGLFWLPVSVPADVVTLPIQALWGALFVIALAGEK